MSKIVEDRKRNAEKYLSFLRMNNTVFSEAMKYHYDELFKEGATFEEVVKHEVFLKNTFTLDNLSFRDASIVACSLNLSYFPIFLFSRIKKHFDEVKIDDSDLAEHLDNLSHRELVDCCVDRGLNIFSSNEGYKAQIKEWLKISKYDSNLAFSFLISLQLSDKKNFYLESMIAKKS